MKGGVMNRDEKSVFGHPNDNDGDSDTDDPGQPGVSSQSKGSLPAVLKKNSTRMESAIIDDEADLLSREKLVAAREDAVHLRENSADLREGTATSREQEIRAAGTIQAASGNHM